MCFSYSVSKSREAHAAQKATARERKLAKPSGDLIHRTKKIWERLRLKSHVPLDERKQLVTELFSIITGRVKEFVFKHDAVRVIQTALKYGNLEQRTIIAKELRGSFPKLAESKYAKFLISKMLVHGSEEIKLMVIPEFFGSVRKIMRHPEASQLLDDLYQNFASPKQKAIFLSEWYGPEFALFRKKGRTQDEDDEVVESDLGTILEKSPEKRSSIMASVLEMIKPLVEKNMHGFLILHDAMLQYLLNAKTGSEELTEFIELLKSDEDGNLLRNLAYTKSGARVASLAFAHGTAKVRCHFFCFEVQFRKLTQLFILG
jgi:pumilio family protein 6